MYFLRIYTSVLGEKIKFWRKKFGQFSRVVLWSWNFSFFIRKKIWGETKFWEPWTPGSVFIVLCQCCGGVVNRRFCRHMRQPMHRVCMPNFNFVGCLRIWASSKYTIVGGEGGYKKFVEGWNFGWGGIRILLKAGMLFFW